MPDDLLTPTIAPADYQLKRKPWRPQSLLVPAILGGPTAVTVLALLNAGRLGLSRRATLTVLGAGLAALAARVAVTATLLPEATFGPARLIGSLAGALAWVAVSVTQKTRYRAYEWRGGEPAALLLPGLAAILLLGLVDGLLIRLVVRG
ncbi:hypothetical protein [Micromonospora sp. WMMD812]|uniref:hypothetical protein n=1 Tax=Micromonospora sp. WMMD812 TaxID=3015152 RepID=UPI00248D1BC9|nr:hypothetical protein [Micromonospora sp. WMMD812]WBB64860.1 hypothetical protein O7603_16645 [Micromonospora sp. WMMD812]